MPGNFNNLPETTYNNIFTYLTGINKPTYFPKPGLVGRSCSRAIHFYALRISAYYVVTFSGNVNESLYQ